jgi:hypothetical protein
MSENLPRSRLIFDQDIALFDKLAVEEVTLYGVSVDYYRLDKRNYDPIDQEVFDEGFVGPFKMFANVEWNRAEDQQDATENGYKETAEAEIRIPRQLFHQAAGTLPPVVGDAVKMFVGESVGDVWFDIVHAKQGEPVYSSASFVWYLCRGRRRSESLPNERARGGIE